MATRFVLFAVTAAAALSVAACGSSNTSSPTTSPGTVLASPTTGPSSAPPPAGEQRVKGLIASVAGNAAQVTEKSGTATVNFTASTKISEVTPGALTDVTVGSCVSVRSKDEPQGGQPLTAASVRVSPAVDGKCPQAKEPAPTTPAPSGTPTGPGKRPAIQGTVASVAGNTITVNTTGTPQSVVVTDKTKYTKEAPSTAQAITQGKCISARGSENGGALQATTISLSPAAKGKCPDGGNPHRR